MRVIKSVERTARKQYHCDCCYELDKVDRFTVDVNVDHWEDSDKETLKGLIRDPFIKKGEKYIDHLIEINGEIYNARYKKLAAYLYDKYIHDKDDF